MDETGRFNPETGKPNPISLKEYLHMDRHEKRAFERALDKSELRAFRVAAHREAGQLRLPERRQIQTALVDKLKQRNNTSIADKIELTIEKARLARLMLPGKEPIFFRKFRTKVLPFPKWMTEAKSPYFVNTPRSV